MASMDSAPDVFADYASFACEELVLRPGLSTEERIQGMRELFAQTSDARQKHPAHAQIGIALSSVGTVLWKQLTNEGRHSEAQELARMLHGVAMEQDRDAAAVLLAISTAHSGDYRQAVDLIRNVRALPQRTEFTQSAVLVVYGIAAQTASGDQSLPEDQRTALPAGYLTDAVNVFREQISCGAYRLPGQLEAMKASPELEEFRKLPEVQSLIQAASTDIR